MNKITLNNFPKNKIYILFKKNFRKMLIDKSIIKLKIRNHYELALWSNKISKKYNINSKFSSGDIKSWARGKRKDTRTNIIHPKFMPLWLSLELANLNGFNINKLQKNVLSYRSGGKGTPIEKPNLPIKITPELESIIIHIFADGSGGNFTPSYSQKNVKAGKAFVNKIKKCFGKFNIKKYKNHSGTFQYRFPKAITDILSKYYNIKTYHSNKACLPIKIFNSNKPCKLACIVAFISDEGYIRDIVILNSSNRVLLEHIKLLTESCNYICNPIRFNKTTHCYYFTISNKSIDIFFNDVMKLQKTHPNCNLGIQQERLKTLIKSRVSNKFHDINIIHNIILKTIDNKPLTINQIANKINYSYSSIRQYIKKIHKQKLVNKQYINGKYLWTKN